ncbi:hypothetical protein D9M71_422810 [compost metagenome]
MHQDLGQLRGQTGRVSRMLRQKHGSAGLGQIFGIAGLVIVDRMGQRHQQRRQTGGRQLAHGQRAGTADHQIGPGVGAGHVADERHHLGVDAGLFVARTGQFGVLLAGLVVDLRTQRLAHEGQRRRQQLVERFGAEAAAEHQQARRAPGQSLPRGLEKQLLAHRIAGGTALGTGGEGVRKSLADLTGEGRQATVGGTGHGILLVDDQRHPGQPGGDAAGAGNEAAHAQHTHRLQLAQHPARLPQRLDDLQRRLEQGQRSLATQAADLDAVQQQAGLRHQLVFDAARRAQPMHGIAARLELAGAGQRREHVAPGAAGHDQDVTGHGAAPPRQNPLR